MSEEARNVALGRVARSPKSVSFTGADLQALVDTAQLVAIHSYLEVKASVILLLLCFVFFFSHNVEMRGFRFCEGRCSHECPD